MRGHPMKKIIPALGVAALVVVVGGTSATAGALVTSKQIKDGTIRVTDLHRSTVDTLTTEPSRTYTRDVLPLLPRTRSSMSVTCPAGTVLTGGGTESMPSGSFLVSSGPSSTPNAWSVTVENTSSNQSAVGIQAVCLAF